MNKIKIRRFIAALFLVLIFARAGECLMAQEPAQIAIAMMIKEEIETLKKILDHQDNMLKRWDTSSNEYENIKKTRQEILDGIKNLREELAKAEGLNHLKEDIETALKNRHPDWFANMTFEQLKDRKTARDTNFRKTVKAYLNAFNKAQSLHEADWKARDALWEVLKKPNGQTQAIQALGGFLDHIHTMMIMNEQAIQAFITIYAEYERDEMDERQDFGKATLEVCSSLKNFNPTAKKAKLGF